MGLSLQHRLGLVTLIVLGIGAVGLTWTKVVQELRNVEPASVTTRPGAVVWGDRVFASRSDLAAWLRRHGARYALWSARHVRAAAVVEHRPAPARAQAHTSTTKAAPAKHRPRAAQPVASKAPSTTVEKTSARRTTAAAVPQSTDGGAFGGGLAALLFVLAALCAATAAMPTLLAERSPRLAASIAPYRGLLLGGAVAVVVGILVGGTS